MKSLVIAIRALLIGMLVLGLPFVPLSSTRAAGFAAPTLVPITAVFFKPITTYVEDATPAPGDKLTYTWSKDNQRNCGVFQQGATAQNQATWSHPDASLGGNCPDEEFHPGVITVVVSDGQWVCTATYPLGSAPGIGPQPAPCVVPPTPTVSATSTASGTPTVTLTPTVTGTSTETGTATNTATLTRSPIPTVMETPKSGCHPHLDVLFTVKATDPADPRIIYIFYAFKGSGFYPGGPIVVTLDNGKQLTTAGDSSGQWIATLSATVDDYPPGPHKVKAVQGDPSSDKYCFKNATFDTNTAEVRQLIQAGKDWLKKIYADDSRSVKRAGNTASGVAYTAGVATAAQAGSLIAIPEAIPTGAITLVSGAVSWIAGWVSDEESNWAADPPDMAIYRKVDLTPRFHAPATRGLPPKPAAAFSALQANLVGRAVALINTSTSINRASTALRLHNSACEVMQYNTAMVSAKQADAYAVARPKLIKNLIAALQAAGIRFKPMSVAAARKVLLTIRAHGISPAMDRALRQSLGAKHAALAEAAALAELRAEPLPTKPIDFLQVLNSEAAEKWYPATPFARLSPGFGVQANPEACKAPSH